MLRYEYAADDGNCPVCGGVPADRLYSVTAAEAARHFVLDVAEPERHRQLTACIRSLWQGDHCRILRCRACGFGYAHPFVAGDRDFYTLAYRRSGYPAHKWEFRQTEAAIARITRLDAGRRFELLEVGAGDGGFVKAICPRYVARQDALCLEYSEYGLRSIRDEGIRAEPLHLLELEAAERRRFDFVCMFQVLEHMDRIDEVFDALFRITKSQGHLFLAVPNAERIQFNECNGALLDMPPNHIGRWTRESFGRVAGRHGWALSDFQTEPPDFLAALRQFAVYRVLREQQLGAALPLATARLRNPAIRKAAQAALAAAYAASALASVAIWSRLGLGDSVWVHLVKGGAA